MTGFEDGEGSGSLAEAGFASTPGGHAHLFRRGIFGRVSLLWIGRMRTGLKSRQNSGLQ